MRLKEYMSLLSCFRPTNLGGVELNILYQFTINEHLSTYMIYKNFNNPHKEKGIVYKNIHKRVKRLEKLNLIKPNHEKYDRGAKHYEITPYGLTSLLCEYRSDHPDYIHSNKKNIVISSLLLEYFEESTIDSIGTLKDDNTDEIGEYLKTSCNLIKKSCSHIWETINKCNINKLLPSDDIIQKYISHLDGKPLDQNVQNEIEQYELRLKSWLNTNYAEISSKQLDDVIFYKYYSSFRHYYQHESETQQGSQFHITEEPPFPLNYIYTELIELDSSLYDNVKSLAIYLVNIMGRHAEKYIPYYEEILEDYRQFKLDNNDGTNYDEEIKENTEWIESTKRELKDSDMDKVQRKSRLKLIEHLEWENRIYKKNLDPKLEDKRPIDLILERFGRDYSMRHIMSDQKFMAIIKEIKKYFDMGYDQFVNFANKK